MVGRQMFLQALLCNCNYLCLLMKRFMKNAAGLLWRPQSLHLMPSRRLLKPFPQVNTFDGLACLCAPICLSRLLIHVVMASHRYFECVYRRTSQGSSNASSAAMAAVIDMPLWSDSGSPPYNFLCAVPSDTNAPHLAIPGLFRQTASM